MTKIFWAALLFSFVACAQKPESKMETTINSSKTSAHVNIPGTGLYLVPPAGFTVSENPAGLKSATGLITVSDLINSSYAEVAPDFDKAALESQALFVDAEKQLTVNGLPGKFVAFQGEASTKIYALIFGDSSFTTTLQGAYPADDKKAAAAIIEAFNSIWYDTTMKPEPMSKAGFSIDSLGDFTLTQHSNAMYFYKSKDGALLQLIEKPWTWSVKVLGDDVVSKLSQESFYNAKATDISTVQINGKPTYEAAIDGTLDDKPAKLYLCVVGDGNKAVILKALAKDRFDERIKAYQKMAHTIKLK